MLCSLPTVQQAAICNCLSFDPFPFDQNGLAPPEIDVGGGQIADALVIAQVILVSDEGLDLSFEFARQVIVLERKCRSIYNLIGSLAMSDSVVKCVHGLQFRYIQRQFVIVGALKPTHIMNQCISDFHNVTVKCRRDRYKFTCKFERALNLNEVFVATEFAPL
jgi:hypothetical protein